MSGLLNAGSDASSWYLWWGLIMVGCSVTLVLYVLFSTSSAVSHVRPALIVASIAGFVCAALVAIIWNPDLQVKLGNQMLQRLQGAKIFCAGVGTGSVLASVAAGQWRKYYRDLRRPEEQ